MDTKTFSHVANCMLWAFLGFVAGYSFGEYTQIAQWLSGTIGTILAGVAGWISVDPGEVKDRFAENWQRLREWEPDREWHRAFWSSAPLLFLSLMSSICLVIFPTLLLLDHTKPATAPAASAAEIGLFAVFAGFTLGGSLTVLIAGVSFAPTMTGMSDAEKAPIDLEIARGQVLAMTQIFSPIGLVVAVFLGVSMMLGWMRREFRAFAAAAWQTVIQVHSERRMLRLIDSATGAAIGLYYGNVGVCLLVGFLVSYAHYEIISRRVLGLEPNGT